MDQDQILLGRDPGVDSELGFRFGPSLDHGLEDGIGLSPVSNNIRSNFPLIGKEKSNIRETSSIRAATENDSLIRALTEGSLAIGTPIEVASVIREPSADESAQGEWEQPQCDC